MVRNFGTVTTAPARTAEPTASKAKPPETTRVDNRASGKHVPASGRNLPPEVETFDAAKAVERLNELAMSNSRDLRFRVDEASGRTVITVINATTKEVVRQIPADEILDMARSMGAMGAIIDAEI
jgi:flagellar protein FlaG